MTTSISLVIPPTPCGVDTGSKAALLSDRRLTREAVNEHTAALQSAARA